MPLIRIREEDFPHDFDELEDADEPEFVREVQPGLEFSREELLHAAWTSGHEQAFFQQQGSEAMHHYCQWKSAAVEMSIREVLDGPESRWDATPLLGAMYPSERQGASYHLGLMMATAWARRRYNIPWLLHIDRYRKQHEVIMHNDAGKSRPDLIGMDTQGRWAVFEAKGRKGYPSTQSKKDAKKQAMRVQTVAHQDPAHRLAVFAYFGPEPDNIGGRCHLQCLVVDPPGDPKHPKPMKLNFITQENFFQHYYQPWLNLFGSSSSFSDDGMLWAPLRDTKMEIGMVASLADALRRQDWVGIPQIASFSDGADQLRRKYGYWAGDGLIVRNF
jgi:hypothetical protein